VINVNDDGSIETKSMIYTDYFVKGTQPTTQCPLHVMSGYATTISAGAQPSASQPTFPGSVSTPSAPVGTSGGNATPAPPVTGGTVKEKEKPQDQPKKKRGFWGRIFGRGGGQ
jgi:hypothetical protein